MSFLDYSFASDISPDAKVLLFDEEGEAGGANYTVFLRKSDRSPVVRLGEGNALAISPDGKWALSMMPSPNSPFLMLPTGTGDPKALAVEGVSPEQAAAWLPDSRGFVFAGSEPGRSLRLYVQSIDGGKPRPITPEGIVAAIPGFAVSPDGRWVAAVGAGWKGRAVSPRRRDREAAHRPSSRGVSAALLCRTDDTCTSGSGATCPRA